MLHCMFRRTIMLRFGTVNVDAVHYVFHITFPLSLYRLLVTWLLLGD
jgi:hypothetical protein